MTQYAERFEAKRFMSLNLPLCYPPESFFCVPETFKVTNPAS
jgi:hypothetical protein